MLITVRKSSRFHSLGRLDRFDGLFGVGQIHRSKFRTEESSGGESLKFLFFSDSFKSLADIDEGRNDLVLWTEHFGHPCTQMWGGHGDRRNITGMPVVLVAGVENRS